MARRAPKAKIFKQPEPVKWLGFGLNGIFVVMGLFLLVVQPGLLPALATLFFSIFFSLSVISVRRGAPMLKLSQNGIGEGKGKRLYYMLEWDMIGRAETLLAESGMRLVAIRFSDGRGGLMEMEAVMGDDGHPTYRGFSPLSASYGQKPEALVDEINAYKTRIDAFRADQPEP